MDAATVAAGLTWLLTKVSAAILWCLDNPEKVSVSVAAIGSWLGWSSKLKTESARLRDQMRGEQLQMAIRLAYAAVGNMDRKGDGVRDKVAAGLTKLDHFLDVMAGSPTTPDERLIAQATFTLLHEDETKTKVSTSC